MNRRHYFLIIIVPILFLVIISPVGRTAAVGSGCRNFQRYGVLAFPSFGPITLQFDKGDTIQIFNSSPYDVSAPSIASGVTGLYTYTFPATGSYQIAAATNPS